MINPVLPRLSGRPLAMAPRQLDALLATTMDGNAPALTMDRSRDTARAYTVTETGIAIVPVIGPLVARHDWLSSLFGAASYGEIGDAVESATTDPAVRAILLEVDSPGGEVGGLFDLVERVGATGKPLWAVASETALSAAYAIASVADRLYVTRTGEVGSVGVVAVHIDESAADAMAGLKWTLIHAGARKVDGNSHQPLSATAFNHIQVDVDALHSELVELVARIAAWRRMLCARPKPRSIAARAVSRSDLSTASARSNAPWPISRQNSMRRRRASHHGAPAPLLPPPQGAH